MLSLSTVEVRWFGHHTVPSDISAWFEQCPGQSESQQSRRDFYLQPIMDGGLSVKLREGGLEIKQRQRSHGEVRLAHSVAGLLEQWVKWRFPLRLVDSFIPGEATESGSWVAVDKVRQQKTILAGEPPLDVPPAPQSRSYAGCYIELTSVRVGKSRWWTVGFEAEFEGRTGPDLLLKVTGQVFRNTSLEQLSIQNSYGYPHWLATLSNDQ